MTNQEKFESVSKLIDEIFAPASYTNDCAKKALRILLDVEEGHAWTAGQWAYWKYDGNDRTFKVADVTEYLILDSDATPYFKKHSIPIPPPKHEIGRRYRDCHLIVYIESRQWQPRPSLWTYKYGYPPNSRKRYFEEGSDFSNRIVPCDPPSESPRTEIRKGDKVMVNPLAANLTDKEKSLIGIVGTSSQNDGAPFVEFPNMRIVWAISVKKLIRIPVEQL